MAHVAEFTCRHCKQEVHEVVVSNSHICAACRAKIYQADEDAHMAKRAAIPLEERVRQLELALYRLDAESRLKALEAYNIRYSAW